MDFEITNGMTAEELRTLQLIELELLLEIDRICRKNGITYILLGGTLLGAVRHKGFIPWDDDADICMTYDQYEKLTDAFKKDLDTSRFIFSDVNHTDGYRFGYGKLYRKDTVFIRRGREDLPYFQGVFADIIPFVYFSNTKIVRFFQYYRFLLIQKTAYSPIGAKMEKKFFIRTIYKILSKINVKHIRNVFTKSISSANRKPSSIIQSPAFLSYKKGYGPFNNFFADPGWFSCRDCDFEGFPLMCTEAVSEMCSHSFGPNYMTPVFRPQMDLASFKLLPRKQVVDEINAYKRKY